MSGLTALAIAAGAASGVSGVAAGGDDRDDVRGGDASAGRIAALERRVAALERRVGAGGAGRESGEVADLSGRWLLTLPAGFEYRVDLESRGEGSYRIDAAELALNHEGVYRVRGDRLEVVGPDDGRLSGFAWRIHNANVLVLVDQPDLGRTGSDYLGATLTRQVR